MSNPVKSKFRGVYKCGKRWKAQLQCQGIQFYLGTFDTEIEAAKAYDRKARDEKGVKGLTNFDENGDEATCGGGPFHSGLYDGAAISSASAQAESSEPVSFANKPKISSSSTSAAINNLCASSDNVIPGMLVTINDNSVQVRMMWERLCQITQRILLCKAAHEKLYELQKSSPDRNKEGLLSNLGDEISLLTQVKQQVEEAIARSVSQSLTATLATTVAADVFAPVRNTNADVVIPPPSPHPQATFSNGGGNKFGCMSHSILNEAHTNESEEEVEDDERSSGDQSQIMSQTGTVEGEEGEDGDGDGEEDEDEEGREYIDEEEGVIHSTAINSSGNEVVEGIAAVPSPLARPPSPYPQP